jgi:hypothetical protein
MDLNPALYGGRACGPIIPEVANARVAQASGNIRWIINALGNMRANANGIEEIAGPDGGGSG